MADKDCRRIRRCRCRGCRSRSDADLVAYHRAINRVMAELDERSRRLFAGIVARQRGHGGVQLVAEITGLSRMTIRRGLRKANADRWRLQSEYGVPAADENESKKNATCAGVVEGAVAGCDGWRSDGWSAVDAQDHPQPGRCIDATWRTGRARDGGSVAASTEVLVAIEPQAVGWEERSLSGSAIPPVGASATAIPTARVAGNQCGYEEKGVGGQLQK